jgi:hypothetical protein
MRKSLLGGLVAILLATVMLGSAGAQSNTNNSNMGTIYVWNLWRSQYVDSVIVYIALDNTSNPSWCALKYGEWCSVLAPAGPHHLRAVDAKYKLTIAETEGSVQPGAWLKWCVYGSNVAEAGRCQAWLNSKNPQP